MKPFTFTYDATQGVLIAAALRERSEAELHRAQGLQFNADTEGQLMKQHYTEEAQSARNRAKLFSDAADAIHAPVKAALAADMDEALRKAGLQ